MDNVSSVPEQPPKATQPDVSEWQRISPIAMLYFLFKFVRVLAGNIVYLAPAIIFGYKTVTENLAISIPALIVLLSLFLLGTFLSYYFFQFRLVNQHVHIRSGVFAKKYVNLPYERVQNIQLLEPVYYRPFGFTCLQLDTAGSNKQEANIVALPMTQALAIKTEILSHNVQHSSEVALNSDSNGQEVAVSTPTDKSDIQSQTSINEHVLITRSLKDLVIHGLSNNRIWIFLGGLTPFYEKVESLIVSSAQKLGIDIELFINTHVTSPLEITLFAIAVFLLVSSIIMLFSVIGAIVSFYGFTLIKHGDRYIRKSGLLSKHEVTMKQSRLQMIVSSQSWLDRIFKRTNLKFEQNSSSQSSHDGMPNNDNKIIVPSVTYQERSELVNDAFPENYLDHTRFKAISKQFIVRYVLYWFTPLLLIACGLLLAANKTSFLPLPITVFAVLSVIVYFRWRRWGYSQDEAFIYVRKGFIGTDHYCFPIAKVQQTRWHQSVFQKKKQLCRVQFVLASGSISIPYMPEDEGLGYCDYALYQVETLRQPWM